MITLSVSAQTGNSFFSFQDSTFHIGQIHRTNCTLNGEWNESLSLECDSLIMFLKTHPELTVEIGWHSDSRPIPITNDTLTLLKARTTVKLLVEKGVHLEQLVAKGYGSKFPIISDEEINRLKFNSEKESAHLTNRRLEIKILAIRNSK